MAINREKYSPVIGIEQEFDEWIEKFRVKKETQRGGGGEVRPEVLLNLFRENRKQSWPSFGKPSSAVCQQFFPRYPANFCPLTLLQLNRLKGAELSSPVERASTKW